MPKIFDNIENYLIDGLKKTLEVSLKADFCVGYFNLRGWKHLSGLVEKYEGTEESCCRLLIGMQRPPEDLLKEFLIAKFSLLLLSGKLFFSKWLTYGDEFHVTRDDLSSIKVPFELIDKNEKEELKILSKTFVEGLRETIQFKLNAGKEVGTFNTSKLWNITDKSDLIFLKYLCDNPNDVFDAIENHVSQTVITTTEEGADEE